MTFYYHMYGSTIGELNVYNNGSKVWSRKGPQGNQWYKATVKLPFGDSVSISKITVCLTSNTD